MKVRRTIEQLNVDFNNDGYKILEQYINKNHTRLIIEDSNGYRFDVDLSNLRRDKKCIVGTRSSFSLYNIDIWTKINNKSFVLNKKDNEYLGSLQKLTFSCLDCGKNFSATWANITQGVECCNCQKTRGEKRVSEWLEKISIDYIYQKKFDDCRNLNPLPFDFGFCKDGKWTVIEYHGGQHYFPVDFAGEGIKKAEKNFNEQKKRDRIKKKYCKDNNIKLIIIPYWKYDKIDIILNKELINE